MTDQEGLESFKHVSPEQKLAVIASEMVRPLAIIEGYAMILKKEAQEGNIQLPDHLMAGIDRIAEAAAFLKSLRAII